MYLPVPYQSSILIINNIDGPMSNRIFCFLNESDYFRIYFNATISLIVSFLVYSDWNIPYLDLSISYFRKDAKEISTSIGGHLIIRRLKLTKEKGGR